MGNYKMKSAILLLLISTITVSSAFLRRDLRDVHGNTIELDAKSVKSPGELSNVAPEAVGIRTAIYAAPKVDINLRITTDSMVTKSHPLGSTPLPKVSERIDHGTKFADVAPYIEDRKMHAQATVWAKTHNFENVKLDVQSGKAIGAANIFNEKKMMHGTGDKVDKKLFIRN